ncbi:FCD domain-containing protein [Streptomyces tendae]|uniref:FCD domain-containing protein n=2 Tax=Streptomyces tendae TaxID=1932 RepID=UPI00364C3D4F
MRRRRALRRRRCSRRVRRRRRTGGVSCTDGMIIESRFEIIGYLDGASTPGRGPSPCSGWRDTPPTYRRHISGHGWSSSGLTAGPTPLADPGRAAVVNAEHRLILDAVRRRDAEDGERYLTGHIRRTRVALTAHP